MSVHTTTDAMFADDVLAQDLPVLVDFTAAWCGPCRMITPVLEQLSDEQADRLHIVSLDVDANPETTRTYQVMSMPTLMLFHRGQPVHSVVGARPKAAILREIEGYLTAPATA